MNSHASKKVVGFVFDLNTICTSNHECIVVISDFVIVGILLIHSVGLGQLKGIDMLVVRMC
jgi:hypothetical protein